MNTRRIRKLLAASLLALLLAGCAAQRMREQATGQLRAGDFEAAIQNYQEGVKQYPEDVALRAGLVNARSEAVTRLVAEAAQARAQGRFDEADKSVKRALAMEPGNERLLSLQGDLALARRQRLALDEAAALHAAGKKEQALRRVEAALREAPRQGELIALQRRLVMELRLDSGAAGQRGLAEGRPITLDFRAAPLSTVLEAITRGSGINFILDRDLRLDSRVTMHLRSAKVDDALDLLTGAHQLARRTIDAQTVLIYPNTPEKQREHQEQVIRVFHLANVDAKSAAAFLRSMLRLREPFVDERANMIAIRETPDMVALAERLIALHDVGEAEVMLEVEILEVKTSRLTELGINFPSSITLSPLPLTGATGLTVDSFNSLNSSRVGVGIGSLLINLKREVGDFNILANPRIRAKSREKAQILIGDKVPVITSTTTATGFVAESVNYLDVGLKLDVEPVVSPDDEVTIKLALEVSSVAKEIRSSAGTVAFQIGTRNAKTVLRLRDGETQVLGGLISNEDRSTSNRVPGLGDLPIAGRLFSSQKDDVQRTELVLAITPRILRSAPHPDNAQAELWIGTELATRLRAAPGAGTAPAVDVRPTTAPLGQSAPAPAVAVATLGSPAPAIAAPSTPVAAGPAFFVGPMRASWQAPAEVSVGEVFSVSLELMSGLPLRGAPLEIGYSAQAVEVLEISEGEFFNQGGVSTNFTHAVNPATGRIGISVLRSDSIGASGRAKVVELRFRAKAAGPTQLRLTSFAPVSTGLPPPQIELPVLNLTVR